VLGAGLDGEPLVMKKRMSTLPIGEHTVDYQVRRPYMLRMEVPQPTSRTTLSLKICGLL
jgi:hypothetical protein